MQTSEPTRPTQAEDTPIAGATLLAEAPTAEAALEEVHATYGPDARIVAAKRVLRGGIGGFFAKEVVQIHAAAGNAAPATPAPASAAASAYGMPAATAAAAAAAASDSPIDRLLADASETTDEVDFATFLRQQLTPELAGSQAMGARPAAPPAPPASAANRRAGGLRAEPRTEPAAMHWPTMDDLGRPAWADAPAGSSVSPSAAETEDGARMSAEADRIATRINAAREAAAETTVPEAPAPAAIPRTDAAGGGNDSDADEPLEGRLWSRTNLVRLGLPVSFVESLEVADRGDDLAWTFALAEALRPLCRPLPKGRALMVGPKARGLAAAIGMPVTAVGQPLLALGDVAAGVTGSETSMQWMERARRGRWLHLVAGGTSWRDLLHADPLAVSWASEEQLPEALRAALELGLVLGYGPVRGAAGRAQPLDVALAIRDLLPFR